MEKLVTSYHWLQLNNEERQMMKQIFNIPRSSGTIMEDSKIKSDGHTVDDLRVVNVASMQKYLESTSEDFDVLFSETIAKVRGVLKEKLEEEAERAQNERDNEAKAKMLAMVASLLSTIKMLPVEGQLEIKKEIDAMFVGIVDAQPKKKNAKAKETE